MKTTLIIEISDFFFKRINKHKKQTVNTVENISSKDTNKQHYSLFSDDQIKHAQVVMHCQGQSMQLFIHMQLINEQWPPPCYT